MEAKREEEWVAQFTRRLRRQWRTLDLQSLEEVAREMWHDESLRAQQAEQAATEWLGRGMPDV